MKGVLISTVSLAANSFFFYLLELIHPIRFPSSRNLVDCLLQLLQNSVDFPSEVLQVLQLGELMEEPSRPVDRIRSSAVMFELVEESSQQVDICRPYVVISSWEKVVDDLVDPPKHFFSTFSPNLLVVAAAEADGSCSGILVQKVHLSVEAEEATRRSQTALGIAQEAAFATPNLEGI